MKPKAYITQKTYPDETRWFIWVSIGHQQKLVTSFRCDTPEQQAECMAFFKALDHDTAAALMGHVIACKDLPKWEPTCELKRVDGQLLQLWRCSDGNEAWRPIPDEDEI